MKRLFITLTLLTLLLTACGATPTEQPASIQQATAVAQIVSTQLAQTPAAPAQAQPQPQEQALQPAALTSALNTDYTDAVSVPEQLLTGTFMLADTNLSLTGEQTAQLITLWTGLKEATQISAAQEQVDALVQQIESALTAEQVKAIADLKITRDSMMAILQDQGVTMGGPQGNGNGPGDGTPPDGTPPAGGPGEGGTPPGMNGTPQAGNPPAGRGNFIQPELIEALIQFLQGNQG
ncbi:MAG: hypothetical protein HY869_11155 [Chloroflexi bacterium]|nr:hypothetical protein [Chloroflexota bacterium]